MRQDHLISAGQLSRSDVETVLDRAAEFDAALEAGDPTLREHHPGAVLALSFFEPSTRTKMSFDAAMKRLGGRVVDMGDVDSSSVKKGESLADTVRVLEGYADDAAEFGSLYHNDASLSGFVLAAHHAGLQIAFHAVGDRAVDQALRMYEAAQASISRPDARHRIEHAQLMAADHPARVRAVGAVVSRQPAFNHVWPHETYVGSLGPDRAQRVDPLCSLRAGGACGQPVRSRTCASRSCRSSSRSEA